MTQKGPVSSEVRVRSVQTAEHTWSEDPNPLWNASHQSILWRETAERDRSPYRKKKTVLHQWWCKLWESTNDIFGANLQRVWPVASGPIRDTQGGDGVASINLWLWCKPAVPWRWCRWWQQPPTWSYLVTHTHRLHIKHWYTCRYMFHLPAKMTDLLL